MRRTPGAAWIPLAREYCVRNLVVQVVDDGRVRVQGVVSSLQAARRAKELVAQIDGVAAVDDALAVEEARGATDEALEQEAQAAAANADPRLSVQVSDGVAILRRRSGESLISNPSS